MWPYLIKRLLIMVPTLIGVLTLTFFVTKFVPGWHVDSVLSQLDSEDARSGEYGSSVAGGAIPRGKA